MELGAGGYPPGNQPTSAFGMPTDNTGINAIADEMTAPPAQAPPRFIKAPAPPPPDEEFQAYAKKYICEYCRASWNFVKKKEPTLRLLRDLFDNNIGIREWRDRSLGKASSSKWSKSARSKTDHDEDQPWSEYVFSPSHLVNSFVANAYPQILDGPEWLTVIDKKGKPQPQQDMSSQPEMMPQQMAPWQTPPAMMGMEGPQSVGEEFSRQLRVQSFLLDRMTLGQIEARIYEAFQSCAAYGSVYAQVFPVVTPKYEWFLDTETGETVEQKTGESYYIVLQQIPLNRILVDPLAKHNDVQRFRGIGHRLDRTYEQIIQDFDSGLYNLNRAEFEGRWAKSKGKPANVDSEIDHDPDADSINDPDSLLQVWAIHIKVPTLQNTIRECVCAIVTEQGVDDPEPGIMVRLDQAPVLEDGLRPFACAHFIPRPGPFGVGLIEDNQTLIYAISQFIGQLIDNTRMCAVGAVQILEGGTADQYLQKVGFIGPMSRIPVGQLNGELAPVPMPNFNIAAIFQVIQYLVQLLEQRTVTAVFQGQNQVGDQTATGEHLQFQQSMRPATTITDLIVRTLVQPLGRIALKMLAQMTEEPQEFSIQNAKGEDIAAQVTPGDFAEGDFDVVVTMTHQDSTRLVKAQTIKDAIPILMNAIQRLNTEGSEISLTELIKELLDALGLDGSGKVISQLSSKEQAMLQQIQDMQQQLQDKERKPPAITIPFEAMPLEAQIQALKLAGINVGMQDYMGFPSTTPPGAEMGNMMPPSNGPGQIGENGGPMGPEPTDQNAMAQVYQELARAGAQTQ